LAILEQVAFSHAAQLPEEQMPPSQSQVLVPSTKRKCEALSSALENHLAAYVKADRGTAGSAACTVAAAVAIGAVGMGSLLLPEEAHARIIYHPTLKRVEPLSCNMVRYPMCHGTVNIDFNNDGIPDAALINTVGGTLSLFYATLRAKGLGSNQVLQTVHVEGCSSMNSAAVLNPGQQIGPGQQFLPKGIMSLVGFSEGSSLMCGAWTNKTGKYLGFKLTIDGETHYGWARVTVRAGSFDNHIGATLTGYAFETVPNVPIAAGAQGGEVSEFNPEPIEPATLGALAGGAASLPLWRSDRK
jgi:hypothetical protein